MPTKMSEKPNPKPSVLTLLELTLFTLIPYDSTLSTKPEDCFIVPASSDNSLQQVLNLSKYDNDLKKVLNPFRHSMYFEWPKLTTPEVCFLFSKKRNKEDTDFYPNRISFKQLNGKPNVRKHYMYRPVASVKEAERDLKEALAKLRKCPGYEKHKATIDSTSLENYTLAEKLVVELNAIICGTIEECDCDKEGSEVLFGKIIEALTLKEDNTRSKVTQKDDTDQSSKEGNNSNPPEEGSDSNQTSSASSSNTSTSSASTSNASSPSKYMNMINAVQKVCPIRIQFLDKSSLLALIGRSFAIHRMSNKPEESERDYNVQYFQDSWKIAPSDDSKALLTRILGSEDDFTLASKIETMGPVLTKALHYDKKVPFWRKCKKLKENNEDILTSSIDSAVLTGQMVSEEMAKNVIQHMIQDWKPYLQTVIAYYLLHMSQMPLEYAVLNELFLKDLKKHAEHFQGDNGNAKKYYCEKTDRTKNPNKYLLQGLTSILLKLFPFGKYKKDTIFIKPDEWEALLDVTQKKRRIYDDIIIDFDDEKEVNKVAEGSNNTITNPTSNTEEVSNDKDTNTNPTSNSEEVSNGKDTLLDYFESYAKRQNVMISSFGKSPLFNDVASQFQQLEKGKCFKVFGSNHAEEMIFLIRFSSVDPNELYTLLPSIKCKEEIHTVQLLNIVYRACFLTFMKFSEIFGPDNKSKKDKQRWDAAFCSRVINNLPLWIVGFHKESMKTNGAFRKEMDNFKETMHQRKAEFMLLADKDKIKHMKTKSRFDTDWKKMKKPSAPEDFPFEVLHKHMSSIYLNLHIKLNNEDQEKKLWEYFVSTKYENPLLEMVKKVKQDATASFDDVERFSATGEPPVVPIDGHILGLQERRGTKQKASGSDQHRPKKRKKNGPGTGANRYVLAEAECSDDDDDEIPQTPSSQGSSRHPLNDTPSSPSPAHKAMHENRSLNAALNMRENELEAEEARKEAERFEKEYNRQERSKDDIIKDFIEDISKKLGDENKKVIDENAKQELENLIQKWLKKIPGTKKQGSMNQYLGKARRKQSSTSTSEPVQTSTVLTHKEKTSTSASEPAKRPVLVDMDGNTVKNTTKRKDDSRRKGANSRDEREELLKKKQVEVLAELGDLSD